MAELSCGIEFRECQACIGNVFRALGRARSQDDARDLEHALFHGFRRFSRQRGSGDRLDRSRRKNIADEFVECFHTLFPRHRLQKFLRSEHLSAERIPCALGFDEYFPACEGVQPAAGSGDVLPDLLLIALSRIHEARDPVPHIRHEAIERIDDREVARLGRSRRRHTAQACLLPRQAGVSGVFEPGVVEGGEHGIVL